MQNQDTQKTGNVVSLFANRDKAAQPAEATESAQSVEETKNLNDVMEKNMRNKERIARERANANKSVLRSYRIKH